MMSKPTCETTNQDNEIATRTRNTTSVKATQHHSHLIPTSHRECTQGKTWGNQSHRKTRFTMPWLPEIAQKSQKKEVIHL
jgi:hypothetical protein